MLPSTAWYPGSVTEGFSRSVFPKEREPNFIECKSFLKKFASFPLVMTIAYMKLEVIGGESRIQFQPHDVDSARRKPRWEETVGAFIDPFTATQN